MKYMLLIHQADAPTPRDPEAWAKLSEDEQNAVYRDYQATNETPGVTSGLQLEAALALVGTLELNSYPYMHSVRGELLRRLGRTEEALGAFERAIELVTAEPERRMLEPGGGATIRAWKRVSEVTSPVRWPRRTRAGCASSCTPRSTFAG